MYYLLPFTPHLSAALFKWPTFKTELNSQRCGLRLPTAAHARDHGCGDDTALGVTSSAYMSASHVAAQAARRCLQEGEIGAIQDGLRLAESVHLASSCFLSGIKILDQPIALTMET